MVMGFIDFLVEAKRNGYASGAQATTLEDGAKVIVFEKGGFEYRDQFYSNNPFSGQELVWQKGNLLWSMVYHGGTTNELVPADDVFEFLRKALSNVSAEHPVRGPLQHEEGKFKYLCTPEGSWVRFRGQEEIYFDERVVYQLNFTGGSMQ